MPTYEYHCQKCNNRFERYLSYHEYESKSISCPSCGSTNIQRIIGNVRIAISEQSRIETMVNPSNLDGIEEDPKALGHLMRRMGDEMGEEMGPEFNEVISRLESGQDPEQIEKNMPDLGDIED